MANVKDDEFETLDFADESEYIDDEDEPEDLRTEIADMIADAFGRSTIDADYDLAEQIIAKVKPTE